MLILDFDLDFIVRPIRRGAADQKSRYSGPKVSIWSKTKFRSLIEKRLSLSRGIPSFGQACDYYVEVLDHTKQFIAAGVLIPPFTWVHIDAHDDITGCSDALQATSANFLLHLIGLDWISHLDFVLPRGEDCPPDCLVKWDPLRIEFNVHKCSIGYHDEHSYRSLRRPDFVFVTKSPDFTPASADPLFELLKKYLKK